MGNHPLKPNNKKAEKGEEGINIYTVYMETEKKRRGGLADFELALKERF